MEEEKTSVLRSYKDSVFRILFNNKENLIQLYNAIFDTNYTADSIVDFTTIQDVLFKTIKNDIAFLLENRLIILVEHQSTVNENMAIRDLLYYATMIQQRFSFRDLYKEKAIKIPKNLSCCITEHVKCRNFIQ